jgi:hypothetical protein
MISAMPRKAASSSGANTRSRFAPDDEECNEDQGDEDEEEEAALWGVTNDEVRRDEVEGVAFLTPLFTLDARPKNESSLLLSRSKFKRSTK